MHHFKQLRGNVLDASALTTNCKPSLTMGDSSDSILKTAIDGVTTLKNEDVANPCGLIARYICNDEFALKVGDTGIPMDEANIAHSVDKSSKFKSPENAD